VKVLFKRLKSSSGHTWEWLSKVILVFLLIVNFICCAWRLLRVADNAMHGESLPPDEQWGEVYVQDVYWLFMTLSAVGYGDIVADGMFGRLFASAIMMVAPAFFGIVVSLLSRGMKKFFDDEIEIQVADAMDLLQSRQVPVEIQRAVERHLRRNLQKKKGMSLGTLHQHLSVRLQRNLSLELLKSTVLKFPLFTDAPRAFVAEISNAHTIVQCIATDLIVETGQLVDEVVFVVSGRITMEHHAGARVYDVPMSDLNSPEGTKQDLRISTGSRRPPNIVPDQVLPESELEAGAWFGERCLFEKDRVRVSSGFAATDSEIAVLLAKDYHRIIQKYPKLLEQHRNMQRGVAEQRLSLSELEYVRPPVGRSKPVRERKNLRGGVFRGTVFRVLRRLGS